MTIPRHLPTQLAALFKTDLKDRLVTTMHRMEKTQQSLSFRLAQPPTPPHPRHDSPFIPQLTDATCKTILNMLNRAETAEAERDEYHARLSSIRDIGERDECYARRVMMHSRDA